MLNLMQKIILNLCLWCKNKLPRKEEAVLQTEETIQKLKEDIVRKKEALANQNNMIQKLRETVAKKTDVINNQLEAREKLKMRIETLSKHAIYFRENAPVNRFLRFALDCYNNSEQLKSDIYIAHGVQALPAASILAEVTNGKYFCDVIEIPSFRDRALESTWHLSNLMLLDNAFENYLRNADGLLTVGWALKNKIKYGVPVIVIPNYRYAETLMQKNTLREMCGLKESDKIILSISTITSGFEDIIEALKLLPEHFHLVTLGCFVPKQYNDEIHQLISDLKLNDRVHVFDQVEYSELTSIASSADVGLIVLNPEILNHYISLPNRIFDYMFSGVPVVSPNIPDIAKIIKNNQMGEVIESFLSPRLWAEAIEKVVNSSENMKENAIVASQKYTWESLEKDLSDTFKGAKTITYLGINNLSKNNRTMRMARTLTKFGFKVKICFPGGYENYTKDGIEFISTPQI